MFFFRVCMQSQRRLSIIFIFRLFNFNDIVKCILQVQSTSTQLLLNRHNFNSVPFIKYYKKKQHGLTYFVYNFFG